MLGYAPNLNKETCRIITDLSSFQGARPKWYVPQYRRNMAYNEKDGMYYGYIYKIINNVNDKVYIGQTRRTIKQRWKDHCNSIYTSRYNCILYNAMVKYGVECFNIVQLGEYKFENESDLTIKLNEEEIKYIQEYNSLKPNGYNLTAGGNNDAESQREPVDKYTISGIFVATYGSIFEASLSVDECKSATHISECCKGKLHTAYGFVWRYKGDNFDKYQIPRSKYELIDKYSLDGVLLETLFINDINYNIEVVCKCCAGINKTAYGFVWRIHGEPFDKYEVAYKKKQGRKIVKTDISMNIIQVYDDVHSVEKEMNVHKSTVCKACKSNKLWNNHYWFYEDDTTISHLTLN